MRTEAERAHLEAVVLAAGQATRFGGGKLTAPWRGGVLLDGVLAAAFAAPVRTVTLVTRDDAGAAMAAAPVFAGRRGHPAVIARSLFPDLLALTGDAGARAILDRLGPALALVAAPDDGVLFDVDERGDLEPKKPGSPLSRG